MKQTKFDRPDAFGLRSAHERERDGGLQRARTTGGRAAFEREQYAPDRGASGHQAGRGPQLHVLRLPQDGVQQPQGANPLGEEVRAGRSEPNDAPADCAESKDAGVLRALVSLVIICGVVFCAGSPLIAATCGAKNEITEMGPVVSEAVLVPDFPISDKKQLFVIKFSDLRNRQGILVHHGTIYALAGCSQAVHGLVDRLPAGKNNATGKRSNWLSVVESGRGIGVHGLNYELSPYLSGGNFPTVDYMENCNLSGIGPEWRRTQFYSDPRSLISLHDPRLFFHRAQLPLHGSQLAVNCAELTSGNHNQGQRKTSDQPIRKAGLFKKISKCHRVAFFLISIAIGAFGEFWMLFGGYYFLFVRPSLGFFLLCMSSGIASFSAVFFLAHVIYASP